MGKIFAKFGASVAMNTKDKLVLIYKYMQDYTIDPTSPSFNSRTPFDSMNPGGAGNNSDPRKKIVTVIIVAFVFAFIVPAIVLSFVFFAVFMPMWKEGIEEIKSTSNGMSLSTSNAHTLSKLDQIYSAKGDYEYLVTVSDCTELNTFVNNKVSSGRSFDLCDDDEMNIYFKSAKNNRRYAYLMDQTHIVRMELDPTYSKVYEIAVYSERKTEIREKMKTIKLEEMVFDIKINEEDS